MALVLRREWLPVAGWLKAGAAAAVPKDQRWGWGLYWLVRANGSAAGIAGAGAGLSKTT